MDEQVKEAIRVLNEANLELMSAIGKYAASIHILTQALIEAAENK